MTHIRIKIVIAGLVLAACASYLTFAAAQKGWVYYLDVDTFLAGEQYQSQRVRLCGRVAEEALVANAAQLSAHFELIGPTRRVSVTYHGVIPDMFKAGSDVVLEGKLDDAGVFQADVLMTKCASKYQAEEHAKRLEPTS